ncbi:MAG TPA: biphenyl 2,3-dioxygenase, partial [Pusillimonas sp.]|nr:biphenyl 2,3-dioxygenase [Pusillimonas sp.]
MYQSQTVIGQTLGSKDDALENYAWPENDLHYIPDWVYTSQEVYDREMELIFRGDTWNFVALEAE